MGVSTSTGSPRASRLRGCVLVTDGDGSLNTFAGASLYTGALCVLVTDGDGSLNAQLDFSEIARRVCVLVTDGDGSLNEIVLSTSPPPMRASSSPTGMGVSTSSRRSRGLVRCSASSSPTGMGVSTRGRPVT